MSQWFSVFEENLQWEMFFLRAADAATMARKMIVPKTKMMTIMKTTPSTPSTMTKSSSMSGKSGGVQDSTQSVQEQALV